MTHWSSKTRALVGDGRKGICCMGPTARAAAQHPALLLPPVPYLHSTSWPKHTHNPRPESLYIPPYTPP